MGGGKKRGQKNQSNQKKGTRKNIAPVEMAEVLMGSSSGSRRDLCPEGELALIRGIPIDAKSNTFYHISNRWWQKWIEYVNQDQQCNTNDGSEHCDSAGSITLEKPSMIDNSDLINSSSAEIIDTLEEGRDYVLLPEEVWNKLHSWYGGGPALPWRVISSGCSQAELAMEAYHLRHELLLVPERYRSAISKSKKIKPLLDAVSHSAQEQKIDLELTVTTSNLGADSLYLNDDNIKSNHWNMKTSSQIDLMNKKKAWRTTVRHSGRRIRICKGWTAFCVDNKFEDGYICKFRKIEGKKLVVTTFELVEVAKSNVCKQGEQPAMLLEEQQVEEQPAVLLEQQGEQPAKLLEEQPEELEEEVEDRQPKELEEEQDLKVQNIGKQQFFQMESQTMELRSSSSFIKQELLKFQEFCTEQVSQLREGIITLSNAAEKCDALLTENQKLFNQVQELKGPTATQVEVFADTKPLVDRPLHHHPRGTALRTPNRPLHHHLLGTALRSPQRPPHHHPLGTALRSPQRPPHHHPLGTALGTPQRPPHHHPLGTALRTRQRPPHHHPLGTALRTPQRPTHHPLGSATKHPPRSTTKPPTGQRKDA
ncbi:B3 DNA binding domain-containing protein [Hirschfeldia incana]|nr:B3 DNA binding domain-containing protein [Hirschfeldia incana]